jgi:hypothetical protein
VTAATALAFAGALLASPAGATTPEPGPAASALPAAVSVEAAETVETTETVETDRSALAPLPALRPLEPLEPLAAMGDARTGGDIDAPASPDDIRWREMLLRIDELEARLAAMEGEPVEPADVDDGLAPADPTVAPHDTEVVAGGLGEAITLTGPVVIEADEVVAEAVSLTGPVDVYGRVLGNAVGMGADVRVHPGGRVDGDAVSLGGRVDVRDGGIVSGDRVALGDPGGAPAGPAAAAAISPAAPLISPGSIDHLAMLGQLRDLARRIAVLLSFAAAGVLVVGFWPRQVDHVAALVSTRPVWYGFVGAVLGALLLGGATLLGLTIIGLPLSLLLVLALAGGGLLGFVSLGKAIGARFPGVSEQGGWLAFLVGAGLLTAVAFLPWFGPALIGLLVLPALGAALASRFGNQEDGAAVD